MIATVTALLIGLQTMPAIPLAQPDPGPTKETWTLEYDIAILPYIEDYKRCLNYGNRVARGLPDFEQQHRADLPRCTKVEQESITASVGTITRRGLIATYPAEQIADTFFRLGQIHIERGRFIDDSFRQRMAIIEQYERTQMQRNDTPHAANP